MSIKALSSSLLVERIEWGQLRTDLGFSAGDAGVGQARILAPPRWTVMLLGPAWLTPAEAALWRATILGLNGQIHQLAVHDLGNPAPRGTMRGTLTLNLAAAKGDTTLSITGGAGQAATTLLQSDWIGIGSGSTRQLVSVAADATANGSGVISVTINQPVRWAQSLASAVTWDKPTALFRQRSAESKWTQQGAVRTGYGLDLVESWES